MQRAAINQIFSRAGQTVCRADPTRKCRVLLSEGQDPRVHAAAGLIRAQGVAEVQELKVDAATPDLTAVLTLAAQQLKNGAVDVVVSGAVATTSAVIKTGLQHLDFAPGTSLISSTFLMVLPDGRTLTYADCGVVPYPDANKLSQIAVSSARTHKKLTGQNPLTAFLSFSTLGSAQHERVDVVRSALSMARAAAPELQFEGELQFDAAFVPEVAQRKAPASALAGRANVLIFPNLDAGNIAYKITERLGGAIAIGPILQGFSKPWLDLSRGCSAEDIALAAAVGVLLQGPS